MLRKTYRRTFLQDFVCLSVASSLVPFDLVHASEDSEESNFKGLINNESPIGPSPKIKAQLSQISSLELYQTQTDLTQKLKNKIAGISNLKKDSILFVPGSRDAFVSLFWAFKPTHKRLLQSKNEYSRPNHIANVLGYEVEKVAVKNDYFVDLAGFLSQANAKDIIYFSNPHLPFGQFHKKESLFSFLDKLNKGTIVIVDECYIQFLGQDFEQQSLLPYLSKYKNLFVLRSFSKIYGLAAMRVGVLFTENPILSQLKELDPTEKKVSASSLLAAMIALEDLAHIEKCRQKVNAMRAHVEKSIRGSSFKAVPGVGNFCTIITNEYSKKQLQKYFSKFDLVIGTFENQGYIKLALSHEPSLEQFLNLLQNIKKV